MLLGSHPVTEAKRNIQTHSFEVFSPLKMIPSAVGPVTRYNLMVQVCSGGKSRSHSWFSWPGCKQRVKRAWRVPSCFFVCLFVFCTVTRTQELALARQVLCHWAVSIPSPSFWKHAYSDLKTMHPIFKLPPLPNNTKPILSPQQKELLRASLDPNRVTGWPQLIVTEVFLRRQLVCMSTAHSEWQKEPPPKPISGKALKNRWNLPWFRRNPAFIEQLHLMSVLSSTLQTTALSILVWPYNPHVYKATHCNKFWNVIWLLVLFWLFSFDWYKC